MYDFAPDPSEFPNIYMRKIFFSFLPVYFILSQKTSHDPNIKKKTLQSPLFVLKNYLPIRTSAQSPRQAQQLLFLHFQTAGSYKGEQ